MIVSRLMAVLATGAIFGTEAAFSGYNSTGSLNSTASNSTDDTITNSLMQLAAVTCDTSGGGLERTSHWYNVDDGPNDDAGAMASGAIQSFIETLKGGTDKTSIEYSDGKMYAYMWIGSMIDPKGAAATIQKAQTSIKGKTAKQTIIYESVDTDPSKSLAFVVNNNNDKKIVHDAVKHWSQGGKWSNSKLSVAQGTIKETLCFTSYAKRRKGGNDEKVGECIYGRMVQGGSVNKACPDTPSEDVKIYNPKQDMSKLVPDQPICCSIGKLPDFRPSENKNGTCFAYEFKEGDSCDTIQAKYYPLSRDEINEFNKDTYGWFGCKYTDVYKQNHPFAGDRICLSKGTPPAPKIDPLAECGPISKGNKTCPLNACCSRFGHCGETEEFCKVNKSPTGAPGTSGCLSNCGVPKPPSDGHSSSNTGFKNIQYFMTTDNKALKTDPFSVRGDIVHYAFMDISPTEVTGEDNDDFRNFLGIGATKVVSFGGWDFSTNKDTYTVFRTGVKKENRDNFANMFIAFLQKYPQVDGLDFDWEYPAAPDDQGEGLPIDDPKDGDNYLEFLKILKSRMPGGKTISVALPASYWYLKGFPVEKMQHYVDYFIYMNYDYNGQWDFDKGLGVGCHVSETNTTTAMGILDKAGVDPKKIVGGLANYGRSFQLADPGCDEVGCPFTGPESGAIAGNETKTPGMLSIREIEYMEAKYDDFRYVDSNGTHCQIATFGGDQWVGFMKMQTRTYLNDFYKDHNYYGGVMWLSNYEVATGNFNQTEVDDELDEQEENDYLGEAGDYVDIFGCYDKWDPTTVEDIGDVELGCKISAAVNYLLNQIDTVADGMSDLLNDDDYKKNYKTYSEYIQSNISANSGYYAAEHVDQFTSDRYCSVSNNNPLGGGTDECTYKPICILDPPFDDPVNTEACGGDAHTKRDFEFDLDFDFDDAELSQRDLAPLTEINLYEYKFKDDDARDTAAEIFSKSLNMNITGKDFSTFSVHDALIDGNQNLGFNMDDCEMPSVAKLIPDPMQYISEQNITDLKNLKDVVSKARKHKTPMDLLSALSPVMMGQEIVESANNINDAGAKISEMKKKEITNLIMTIVLTFVGVASMFAPAEVAVVIDMAALIAQLAVSGSISPGDVAAVGGGIFGLIFKEVRVGKDIADITQAAKTITKNTDVSTALRKFGKFAAVGKAISSQCKK